VDGGALRADGSSTDGSSSADGATDGAATGDAATGDAAVACTTLTPGPVVAETIMGGLRPGSAGGTLVPGTYKLTERDFYTPSADGPPGGDTVQGALVIVDGTKLSLVHVQNAAGLTTTIGGDFSYVVAGTVISETQTCPNTNELTNMPFTVSGTDLWLFPTGGTREIYTRQ
jgi:hypothetical protein